ncbi:kinase [Stenotrophomonas sp. ATCM1_4]|jgi:predicted Ser/Thr protein kinase|uniref:non-specific serine/threonine protein kinase n=1 Tax=Stenotrophomonas capsici TaxID=3110230 RepID=A0ABU5V959_9GAMM|nr:MULTISPECIES: RIO1 family regulatory kinase/ATPase [unclassified Stenotrophomonas]MBD9537390.1 kinase [Stenotrophomonas sp. STM01]MEA5669512.1 RIO1 family regulatory kinase/ATPase [Stenotrophomonas sp. MH1]TDB26540.1 kinase [Stenotrophomonas sp. ATCM1_4]
MNSLPAFDGEHAVVPTPNLLKRGERLLEPDVYRTELDGRPAVVKDYRRYRGTPLAPVARLLVRREARVLERLKGWKHAPALLGTLGGLALGMEFIPGDTLSAGVQGVTQEVFDQLQNALGRLHAAGITHNDLHGTNVVVSAGVPVLLDFTSAWRSPRWLRNGPISRQLRRSDMKNLVKMRQRLTGQRPSAEQVALLAEPGWVQAIRGTWKRLYRRIKGQE